MKTITISMLFVLIACISNAQIKDFNEFKIKTFSTKTKAGTAPNTVKFLDDVEFQKVVEHLEKKKTKKLGETIIGPDNLGKEYFCTNEKGNSADMICFRVFEITDEKNQITLEFKIVNNQSKNDGEVNEFYYHVNKKFNYVLTLKSCKKNSYTFLISPNETSKLAEK